MEMDIPGSIWGPSPDSPNLTYGAIRKSYTNLRRVIQILKNL